MKNAVKRLYNFPGNVRKDRFGRIVVDLCGSDGEHLTRDLTAEEQADRQKCRYLVEQAFEEFVGKKGTLMVEVTFREEG